MKKLNVLKIFPMDIIVMILQLIQLKNVIIIAKLVIKAQ
jgi:hypothetical protein